jgi:hypothetical protein
MSATAYSHEVRPLPQTKLRGITIPFGINTKEKKYQEVCYVSLRGI